MFKNFINFFANYFGKREETPPGYALGINYEKDIVKKTLVIDALFRYDGVESDLHSFETFEYKDLDSNHPILDSDHLKSYIYRKIPDNFVEARAIANFYYIYSYLTDLDMTNILIAGGSVSNSILRANIISDIDMFIYGTDINGANECVTRILEYLTSHKSVEIKSYKINKYNITIHFKTTNSKRGIWFSENTLQIMFRLYKTKSEILHGFDIGSSAVGFDGRNILFTSLSKFSYEYRCNILDVTRRSTTYERRLIKYFKRGFDIILPNLNVKMLKKYRFGVFLPYMIIKYAEIFNNRLIILKIIDNNNSKHDDYDSDKSFRWGNNLDKVIKIFKCDSLPSYSKSSDNANYYDNFDNFNNFEIIWQTTSPGSQLTSSFNPVFKDAKEWYGIFYIL